MKNQTGDAAAAPAESVAAAPAERAAVKPLYIGPANALAVIGIPWRRLREHAVELGIPLVALGKARLIPADLLVAALEKSRPSTAEIMPTEIESDPAAVVRRMLGKRRRAA